MGFQKSVHMCAEGTVLCSKKDDFKAACQVAHEWPCVFSIIVGQRGLNGQTMNRLVFLDPVSIVHLWQGALYVMLNSQRHHARTDIVMRDEPSDMDYPTYLK